MSGVCCVDSFFRVNVARASLRPRTARTALIPSSRPVNSRPSLKVSQLALRSRTCAVVSRSRVGISRAVASDTPTGAPHNFAPASGLDNIVHGCESPGNPQDTDHKSSAATVDAWMEFMASQGVSRVVCLMDDDELKRFDVNLLETYATKFAVSRVNMKAKDASSTLLEAFSAADAAGEKVVTHCVGGQHRTGMALSAWVATKHKLSPADAVEQMLTFSAENNASRGASAEKLTAFLGDS